MNEYIGPSSLKAHDTTPHAPLRSKLTAEELHWITICFAIVIFINLFGARGYGEAESIFASIKILTIVGCIWASQLTAVPVLPARGLMDSSIGGAQGRSRSTKDFPGSLGRFLSFWAVLTQAAFSFFGTEVLAIAAGETKNPQRTMKSAINKVWIRICIFYILGVFIMGLVVPSNNLRLGTASNASASPFVIAADLVGIKAMPHIINACILSSAWSAATADLYSASRSVYGIALNGDLPRIFLRTNKRGLPYVSIGVCALFGSLAYMGINRGSNTVFGWLANMTAVAGLLSWLAICVTYLRFRAGLDAQGIDRKTLPFTSAFAKPGAYYSITLIIIVCFFSGWTVFLPGQFTAATFVTNYLPCLIFPILFVGKKVISKTKFRRVNEMDFTTGLPGFDVDDREDDQETPRTVLAKVSNFFV